jgi:hypothetical protein
LPYNYDAKREFKHPIIYHQISMIKRLLAAIFIISGLKEESFLYALVAVEGLYIFTKLLIRPYRHSVFWLKLIGDLFYFLALLLLLQYKAAIPYGSCRNTNEDNMYSVAIIALIWLFIIFYILSVLISFCLFKKKQVRE